MKRTRRKELKTNVLSVYLQQIYEAAARNATYLIGGVVVVVLVLAIGLLVQRNRLQAMRDAWNSYEEIRSGDVVTNPALLDRARMLAGERGDDSNLGPLVLELEASLAHELALSLIAPENQARRIELLKDARKTYEQLLQKFSDRRDAAARARMSLAKVEESLLIAGEGDVKKARKLYLQLIDAEPNPFQKLAKDLLDSLDERIAKLEIVASRPAEEPVSTKPAPTTQPATATMPAPATKPATATQPATMPATAPAS